MHLSYEQQYLQLIDHVLAYGQFQENRTGVPTIGIIGAVLRANIKRDGFPAMTTRKLAFKSSVGEMIGFLRASDSARQFRDLGCKFWDQNANVNADWLNNPFRQGEDHLGPVYGVQWRQWPAYKVLSQSDTAQLERSERNGYQVLGLIDATQPGGAKEVLLFKKVDQLKDCLDTIVRNPTSRRILFHGWNPATLDEVALPPCHLLYQFHPNPTTREMSMTLFIRSNDLGLGQPANMCEAAALLCLVCRLTGYQPLEVVVMISDAHIYTNHLDMLKEQLTRKPFASPMLSIAEHVPAFSSTGQYDPTWLEAVAPSDFSLIGYEHHPALTAPMAV